MSSQETKVYKGINKLVTISLKKKNKQISKQKIAKKSQIT